MHLPLRSLVTGATSGIGRALALELARRGHALAICGRDEARLEAVASDCRSAGASRVLARAFCVGSEPAITGFVADAVAGLGGLDLLVNNAGLNCSRAPVAELRTEDLDWMYTVNCRAPMVFIRAGFPALKACGRGRVVNILSTTCLFGSEGLAGYTASKMAAEGITRVFRKEAKAAGIAVTAVYPGGVDTAFRPNARPEYMRPESVALAVAGLLDIGAGADVHELVLRPPCEGNHC